MTHRIQTFDELIAQVSFFYEDTVSTCEQKNTEHAVRKCYETYLKTNGIECLQLNRTKHFEYLKRVLRRLPQSYESLDASQPWLCYWITNALTLLNYELSVPEKESLRVVLASCQHKDGGFSGGPYQLAHLATTFGAINCICLLNDPASFEIVDRPKLYQWLTKLRTPEGAFRLHLDGEMDVRGAYCAISVAKLTNLDLEALFVGTAEWIASCQTYEGGFGGAPGLEAHGGYTFCAFAALYILKCLHLIDLPALLRWAVNRQMAVEGGFQGRTNKLVDSCYSYWVGCLFPLLHDALSDNGDDALSVDEWLFDQRAAQEYILLCCQRSSGGLIDKPGRSCDPYHTCYSLSGLSVAQHFNFGRFSSTCVVGDSSNMLNPTVSAHNISSEGYANALKYFNTVYNDKA